MRPAGRVVEALQRRRQVEAHDRRAIVASHPRELLEGGRGRRAILGEQLDGPGANVLVAIARAPASSASASSRRSRAAPTSRAAACPGSASDRNMLPQLLVRLRFKRALRRAVLQDDAGAPRVPVAAARLQTDELRVGHLAADRRSGPPTRWASDCVGAIRKMRPVSWCSTSWPQMSPSCQSST